MKVASVGTSKALHAMGAKKESVNTFPTYYAWRNWIHFFSKYTPRERLEKMTETLLGSVFEEVYAGIHKGEYNRMKTVMLAYDDAIHGVMGKAGPGRIFEIDFNEAPFRKLFSSGDAFYIEEGSYPGMAAWLRELPGKLGMDVTWVECPKEGVRTIVLCESIFKVRDLSLADIYVDIDDCILQDEQDALRVMNYSYSKKSFILAGQPVFLQQILARMDIL
jgi:hypothetical protein